MKYLLVLLAALFSLSGLGARGSETSLTVLTYNIKGLPAFIAQGYDENRFTEIGRILAERNKKDDAPDIVLLQESFVERTGDLRRAANYPFWAKGPDSARALGVDSGLYILSKFPILEQKNRAFGEGICADWDCYANKGVQFARIQVPGLPFTVEIFNTHMQASRSFDAIRRQQVEVLAAFVKENHQKGSPIIFGGDFNFRPKLEEGSYKDFLAATKLVLAAEQCADCAHPEKNFWRSIVDHQFIASCPNLPFRLVPLALARTFTEAANGYRLSDHLGYEMKYKISWGASGRQKLIGAQKH